MKNNNNERPFSFCDADPRLPVFYALGYHPTFDKIFFCKWLTPLLVPPGGVEPPTLGSSDLRSTN